MEYDAYRIPAIATSQNFRQMCDIIGDPKELDGEATDTPPCLVLEWLNCTLREVPSGNYRRNYMLLDAVINACLSSLATLNGENLVHTDRTPASPWRSSLNNTDIKPDNILLSDVDTDHLTVKVGDLGLVRQDPVQGPAQPFALRAPEVYRGLGCSHRSDVWSLAATLFCWIKPGVFGTPGNVWGISPESWCITKLMQLFPGWTGPSDEDELRQSQFTLAEHLSVEPDPNIPDEKVVKVSSLENEMQHMGIEPVLMDLFRYLFVVNPDARPSAAEALASKEYTALRNAALAQMQPGDGQT